MIEKAYNLKEILLVKLIFIQAETVLFTTMFLAPEPLPGT